MLHQDCYSQIKDTTHRSGILFTDQEYYSQIGNTINRSGILFTDPEYYSQIRHVLYGYRARPLFSRELVIIGIGIKW